jgi:hypothetical protein
MVTTIQMIPLTRQEHRINVTYKVKKKQVDKIEHDAMKTYGGVVV